MPTAEIKIGQVIKRLLKEYRLNLKELSRETGIPYSTLYTWSENRQPKDILKVQRLASHFGISIHELIFDLKDKKEEKQKTEARLEVNDEFFKGRFEIIVRRLE